MLPSIIERDVDRWTYQVYVTEALKIITENTAVPAAFCSEGKAGKSLNRSWADLDKPAPPEDTRTPEEVIEQLKRKCQEVRSDGPVRIAGQHQHKSE